MTKRRLTGAERADAAARSRHIHGRKRQDYFEKYGTLWSPEAMDRLAESVASDLRRMGHRSPEEAPLERLPVAISEESGDRAHAQREFAQNLRWAQEKREQLALQRQAERKAILARIARAEREEMARCVARLVPQQPLEFVNLPPTKEELALLNDLNAVGAAWSPRSTEELPDRLLALGK